MRGSRGCTVGGGNVVKPPLTLQLEDAKTQGFSSYSNTYPFNYLFGDKELLARQVGFVLEQGFLEDQLALAHDSRTCSYRTY